MTSKATLFRRRHEGKIRYFIDMAAGPGETAVCIVVPGGGLVLVGFVSSATPKSDD